MPRRLLDKQALQITRAGTNGNWNDDGEWVEGTQQTPFEARGSIQPFRQGKSEVELPQGITAKDVRLFYTKTEILMADEYINQEPDETEIDGIPYECMHVEPWIGAGIRNNHYKVYFVRKDKMNVT